MGKQQRWEGTVEAFAMRPREDSLAQWKVSLQYLTEEKWEVGNPPGRKMIPTKAGSNCRYNGLFFASSTKPPGFKPFFASLTSRNYTTYWFR